MTVLRVVAALVARWPWRALGAPGAVLGLLGGSVVRWRRAHVLGAMRRAGIARPREATARMYRDLGRGALELLWLAGASDAARRDMLGRHATLAPDAGRILARALEAGPVVIAASHTGNWEVAAASAASWLQRRGHRLLVVAKAQSVGAIDTFVRDLRVRLGLALVAPKGALDVGLRALGAGDVVAMPIDQVPERVAHADRASFLGAAAWIDRAPLTLACRARAQVLVVAARREGPRHVVHVVGVLPPRASDAPASTWIAEATRDATAMLDGWVRRAPSSWLWLHRRWRDPRNQASKPHGREVAAAPSWGPPPVRGGACS